VDARYPLGHRGIRRGVHARHQGRDGEFTQESPHKNQSSSTRPEKKWICIEHCRAETGGSDPGAASVERLDRRSERSRPPHQIGERTTRVQQICRGIVSSAQRRPRPILWKRQSSKRSARSRSPAVCSRVVQPGAQEGRPKARVRIRAESSGPDFSQARNLAAGRSDPASGTKPVA